MKVLRKIASWVSKTQDLIKNRVLETHFALALNCWLGLKCLHRSFILTRTLEKFCKKRVYGKKTLTTCISETLLNKTHHGIFVWNRNNRLHTSNKKHVFKNRKETTQVEEDKYNVCQHGHKTGIQEEGSKHSP